MGFNSGFKGLTYKPQPLGARTHTHALDQR